jgi:hypothetical protein
VLDAGALIAIERGDERMSALLDASRKTAVQFLVPAGALAQAWRDGTRQTRLARFLKTTQVAVLPLSDARARASGQLCGIAGTRDVIDASVVLAAREHQCAVVTGDRADLRVLNPSLELHLL